MEEKEILSTRDFVDAVERDIKVKVNQKDVCIGRLEFLEEEAAKDNGYVCFFCRTEEKFLYLKAFKGNTERKVNILDADKVKVKRQFSVRDAFASAYKNTCWYIIPDGEGFYLITQDEKFFREHVNAESAKAKKVLSAEEFAACLKQQFNIDAELKRVGLGRLTFPKAEVLEDNGQVVFFYLANGLVWYLKAYNRDGQCKVKREKEGNVRIRRSYEQGDVVALNGTEGYWIMQRGPAGCFLKNISSKRRRNQQ